MLAEYRSYLKFQNGIQIETQTKSLAFPFAVFNRKIKEEKSSCLATLARLFGWLVYANAASID
ncbi:hypothetical protein DTQ70_09695 [Runella sp. SP2]|nr:hypothetical protein DTQ70_09695 [Runella sp. SP2]